MIATTTQPFKVLYLDHVARWSGGEIALFRLLTALRGNVAAHVILGEDGILAERLLSLGVTVEVMPLSADLRDVTRQQVGHGKTLRRVVETTRYASRLRRRIRQLNPDIVHTNSLKAALLGGVAARAAGVPVLWHIRDRIAQDYMPRRAVRVVHAIARVLPTAVVSNSASTRSTLPRCARGVVLYDPVDPADYARDRVRGNDASPLRIGMVGRLTPWKGQHVFLEAFARAFATGGAEARIIGSAMFGEEAYAESLHALASSLGIDDRVIWRGFREDINTELAQLDVLVHCSVTPEPFGQVVVEGMAAGLAVIAADAGGPAEIITTGIDGILVSPSDTDALAEAMVALAEDRTLRENLGRCARESVQRFSYQAAAETALRAYGSVVLPRRRRR